MSSPRPTPWPRLAAKHQPQHHQQPRARSFITLRVGTASGPSTRRLPSRARRYSASAGRPSRALRECGMPSVLCRVVGRRWAVVADDGEQILRPERLGQQSGDSRIVHVLGDAHVC